MDLEFDENDAEKTWLKTENKIKTLALGDGTSDGKEHNFQEYFNKGYSQGYKNGFAAGYFKGCIFGEKACKNAEIKEHELLKTPKTGWCQICINKELESKQIAQVIAEQTEIRTKNLQTLHAKYAPTICFDNRLFNT